LSELKYLNFHDNNLNGPIPESIGINKFRIFKYI